MDKGRGWEIQQYNMKKIFLFEHSQFGSYVGGGIGIVADKFEDCKLVFDDYIRNESKKRFRSSMMPFPEKEEDYIVRDLNSMSSNFHQREIYQYHEAKKLIDNWEQVVHGYFYHWVLVYEADINDFGENRVVQFSMHEG